MDDPGVYLEKLSYFSRMLRREGLPVSPKETADAAQILTTLGFAQRAQVKTALKTVFAKSREEQLTFDRVFDGFFLSEEAIRQQAQEQMEREAEQARQQQIAQEDLKNLDFSQEQLQAYASMSEEKRKKLRNIKEKYGGGTDRSPDIYTNLIHSVFAKAILEQQMLLENAGAGVEETDPEMGLLYRDISAFQDTEIPKAISIIQGITQQINGELTAKRSPSGHSGKLDFRKTIRKGLETGGSFSHLCYRRKRQHRKKLVLLCDVSGSMIQFSEFALRFIQSLNQVSDSSRVFLFSEELHESDPFSLQNMDLFRNTVRASSLYGKGTDLGTALEKLNRMSPAALSSATTLLILSDTKTIDQPRAIQALLESKRLAGRVIWLNPIPQGKWQYLRSVQTFAGLCAMVPCSTLRELANACRRLTIS